MQLAIPSSIDAEETRRANDPLFRLLHGVVRIRHLDLRARLVVLLWRMEEQRLTTLSEPETVELDGACSDWSATARVEGSASVEWAQNGGAATSPSDCWCHIRDPCPCLSFRSLSPPVDRFGSERSGASLCRTVPFDQHGARYLLEHWTGKHSAACDDLHVIHFDMGASRRATSVQVIPSTTSAKRGLRSH